MNDHGIDAQTRERLQQKWSDLCAQGREVQVEYCRVLHPDDESCVLLVDVLQQVDGQPLVTETVQKQAGEVESLLGIAGLSLEGLVDVYGKMIADLHPERYARERALVVTMTPTSPVSGELSGRLERPDGSVQTPVQVRFRHYCVLRALRERMVETLGAGWTSVQARYHPASGLELYFDY